MEIEGTTVFLSLKNNSDKLEELAQSFAMIKNEISKLSLHDADFKQDIIQEMLCSINPIIDFFKFVFHSKRLSR